MFNERVRLCQQVFSHSVKRNTAYEWESFWERCRNDRKWPMSVFQKYEWIIEMGTSSYWHHEYFWVKIINTLTWFDKLSLYLKLHKHSHYGTTGHHRVKCSQFTIPSTLTTWANTSDRSRRGVAWWFMDITHCMDPQRLIKYAINELKCCPKTKNSSAVAIVKTY